MQEQAFERAEEPPADHLIAPDDQRTPCFEAEILRGHVVTDQLDLTGVRDAQPSLVRHSQKWNRERVEPHQLRRDRVDRDRIRGSQDEVLDAGNHRARPCTIAGNRAIHHGEDGRVQLSLHVKEIHEDLVHVFVRVVTHLAQQPAKGILHRPGHHRVPMCLDRWQVHDLSARVDHGDLDPFRKDLVQLEKRARKTINLPLHFGQRHKCQGVTL
jgi:hypothetical protein